MAVIAHRERFLGFSEGLGVDALAELFVDAMVAFGASRTDILSMDARFGIVVW